MEDQPPGEDICRSNAGAICEEIKISNARNGRPRPVNAGSSRVMSANSRGMWPAHVRNVYRRWSGILPIYQFVCNSICTFFDRSLTQRPLCCYEWYVYYFLLEAFRFGLLIGRHFEEHINRVSFIITYHHFCLRFLNLATDNLSESKIYQQIKWIAPFYCIYFIFSQLAFWKHKRNLALTRLRSKSQYYENRQKKIRIVSGALWHSSLWGCGRQSRP